MDYLLNTDSNGQGIVTMSFDAVTDIRNNIMLSYLVKKGAFFIDLNFGSRLHEIKSTSPSDCNLAKAYCKESVAWMLKIKKIVSFDVAATAVSNKIHLYSTAILPSGDSVSYSLFLRVI